MNNNIKAFSNKQKGITLIALVITIIVLLILAGISIATLTGNNGLLAKAKDAADKTNKCKEAEQVKLDIIALITSKGGENPTEKEIKEILGKYFKSVPDNLEDLTQELTTKDGGYKVELSDVIEGVTIINELKGIADGSWNEDEGVNTPKLVAGLTAVKFDNNGNPIEVHSTDYANWYDYESKEWANAVTKDKNGNITGYWVWIPRYEYKINTSTKTTTVKFIPISKTEANKDYEYDHVHPAFCNGSSSHYMNGEWDTDLPGFWVAKFPAGYQQNTITDTNGTLSTTISNTSNSLILSNKNYTNINQETVPVGTINTSTPMSLPVFLPLTYAYNCICIGDCYALAQEISKSKDFYGLSESSYSHMLKNSEWGAIAYLTQSQYGRNGIEPNINNYSGDRTNSYRSELTGIYANGIDESLNNELGSAWYTGIGKLGSSTGNETGVYDLNGCIWEFVAGYIINGSTQLTNNMGALDWVTTTANVGGDQTISEKYYTVYPYDSNNDNSSYNWNIYKGLKNSTYGFGDAILETSTSGYNTTSWYSDFSYYPETNGPFFMRGGRFNGKNKSGIFAFNRDPGVAMFTSRVPCGSLSLAI